MADYPHWEQQKEEFLSGALRQLSPQGLLAIIDFVLSLSAKEQNQSIKDLLEYVKKENEKGSL